MDKLLQKTTDSLESNPLPGDKPVVATVTETKISPGQGRFFGTCLAFHLGSGSVQMAVGHHSVNGRRITSVSKTYISSDLTGVERQDFVRDVIEGFLAKHGNRRSQVVVSMGATETTFRTFHMPILRKAELDSAIRLEAEKQIPFPIDESILDYRRIAKISAGGRTRYRVALQAATKDKIESILAPFRDRGIKVHHVYSAHDAIGQLLKHLPDFDPEASYGLLNVNQQDSEIAFYRGTSLEFIHVSNTGSAMVGTGSSVQYEYLGETLASEIQTSLDYYSGQYRTPIFSKIYIYGDLAYCKEIITPLRTRLGYEFLRFPTERLPFLTNSDASNLDTAAVCLSSLSTASCNVQLANLLPPEDKAEHARRKLDFWGRISLVVFVIMMSVSWTIIRIELDAIRDAALDATRQVEEFRSSEAYHHYNILKAQIASARSYLSEAQRETSYLGLSLKELSLLTPDGIYLDQFRFEQKDQSENLIITGRAVSNTIPPEVMVAEYLEALNASPFYSEVTIKRHQKTPTSDGFQIEFSLGLRGII